jgi:hypothetical protein
MKIFFAAIGHKSQRLRFLSSVLVFGMFSLMLPAYAADDKETKPPINADSKPKMPVAKTVTPVWHNPNDFHFQKDSRDTPAPITAVPLKSTPQVVSAATTPEARFAELEKMVAKFEKKPFLTGTLVSDGKTYIFQYRRFDKPLNLSVPFRCSYELNVSPLRSELSVISLWHDQNIKSIDTLRKWENGYLPECRKRIKELMVKAAEINKMPVSDYLVFLNKNTGCYEILGEIKYGEYHVLVTKSGELASPYISGICYVKDDNGNFLRDIKNYMNNVFLVWLSQDHYSIIADAFKKQPARTP